MWNGVTGFHGRWTGRGRSGSVFRNTPAPRLFAITCERIRQVDARLGTAAIGRVVFTTEGTETRRKIETIIGARVRPCLCFVTFLVILRSAFCADRRSMELSGVSALPAECIDPFDKLMAGPSAPSDGASGWQGCRDGETLGFARSTALGFAFAGRTNASVPTRASLVREFVDVQPADRFLVLIGRSDVDCAVHDGW